MIEVGKLKLDSDFDYRIIREENNDIDIYIDINYRCVDINVGESELFNSRIQFPYVRSILLRINKEDYLMTVHLMRDIDLFSAFANFEVDFSNSIFKIKNLQEKVIISKN
ncbi:hypothetical protein [Terrisporobacter glycolicus]|uniref:Uncharacterized protein n=1 Tax=Terrisporobacter glycolicus ATCC 14880 = DSM 1288 TaxID=1121315 RepID=A0ABZ2EPY3_9FIRM|nr:hypothetical protein [Terrisporobacter glycolicus]